MEVKIFNSYDELLNAAKSLGIKDTKLDQAAETSNVPASGKIEAVELVDNDKMSHIRVKFSDGSRCSVNRLRGQAFFGTKAKAEFANGQKPETAKFKFLKTSILNSNIPANQARIVELVGKQFTAEKVTGMIVPLKTNDAGEPIFHETETTAKDALTAKDFWKITFIE